MTDKYFKAWLSAIVILFLIAICHQVSLAEVTASLDVQVICKVTVMDRHGVSKAAELTGIATEVVNDTTFLVDFTESMLRLSLPAKLNPYVRVSSVSDCYLRSTEGLSQPGT